MKILTRKATVEQGQKGPKTWDAENRSVSAIIATETPVQRTDYIRGAYSEILLNSGMKVDGDRVPLQDSHNRWDTKDTIGSVRDFQVGKKNISGTVFFSDAEEAQGPALKVSEGHLNSFSVGYIIEKAKFIEEKKTAEIRGKQYAGPALVATKWRLKEVSLVAVPADPNAKARNEEIEIIEAEPVADNNQKREEEMKISKSMKAFLKARGMPDGLEDGAIETWMKDNVEPADIEAEQRAAIQAERGRMIEIMEMGRKFSVEESVISKLIDNEATIDEARKQIMENMSLDMKPVGHKNPIRGDQIVDQKDKFRDIGQEAMDLLMDVNIESPRPEAQQLAGRGLKSLARESLRAINRSADMGNHALMAALGQRALTTSDFPLLLSTSATKMLFQGFDSIEETYQQWAGVSRVSDFKVHNSYRRSLWRKMEEVPEGGKWTYRAMTETGEPMQVARYAMGLSFTEEMMINDDLGAFRDLTQEAGEASREIIGDVVYAVVTDNANTSDGNALFSVAHANLAQGADIDPINTATLNAAELALMTQHDIGPEAASADRRRLRVMPQYILAPYAMKGASEQFLQSPNFTGADNTEPTANIWGSDRISRVYEPRLDADSATRWYMFGPKGKTINVILLRGRERPRLQSKDGWTTYGMEMRTDIVVGAAAMAWEAVYRNDGT